MQKLIYSAILAILLVGIHGASGQCDSFSVDFSLTSSQKTEMLCAPKVVSFKDQSTFNHGDELLEWKWNFGDDADISTLQDPFHTYLNNGKYSVSLEVTSKNGCKAVVGKPEYITILGPHADFTILEDTTCLSHPVYLINNANPYKFALPQSTNDIIKIVEFNNKVVNSKSDTIMLAFFEPQDVNIILTAEVWLNDPIKGEMKCSDTYPDLINGEKAQTVHVTGEDFDITQDEDKFYIENLTETPLRFYWVLDGRDTIWNKDTIEYKNRQEVCFSYMSASTDKCFSSKCIAWHNSIGESNHHSPFDIQQSVNGTITVSPSSDAPYETLLVGMDGKTQGQPQRRVGKTIIDISSLKPGIYLLQLKTNTHTYSTKVLR